MDHSNVNNNNSAVPDDCTVRDRLPVRLLSTCPVRSDDGGSCESMGLVDAVKVCNIPAAEELLRSGADPLARNNKNECALLLATQCKDEQFLVTLLRYIERSGKSVASDRVLAAQLLYRAASSGMLGLVRALLDMEIDPSASVEETGNTPLHVAVFHGHIDVCKVLLVYEARVNVQSRPGFTPLHVAAVVDNLPIVRLLLQNGADPLLRTQRSMLPSECAVSGTVMAALKAAEQDALALSGGSAGLGVFSTVSEPVYSVRRDSRENISKTPVTAVQRRRVLRQRIVTTAEPQHKEDHGSRHRMCLPISRPEKSDDINKKK